MAIRDQFPSRGALSSARQFFAITPHADNELPEVPRGVWVGGAGNINMIGAPGSDAVVIKGVPAGTLLPISPTRILVASTTATDLVGLV